MSRWWLALLFALLPLQMNWAAVTPSCAMLSTFAQARTAEASPIALVERCSSATDHHHHCSACHMTGALPVGGHEVLPLRAGTFNVLHAAENFVPADIPQDIERPKW